MQVERQPKVAEIKSDTGWHNLRTSQICELRKNNARNEVQISPKGLAVLRKMGDANQPEGASCFEKEVSP